MSGKEIENVEDKHRKGNYTCKFCCKTNNKCNTKIQLIIPSIDTSTVNGARSILNEENDTKMSSCYVCGDELTHNVQTCEPCNALCHEHRVETSEDQLTCYCVTCASLTEQVTRPNNSGLTLQDREVRQNQNENIAVAVLQPTSIEPHTIHHTTADSTSQAITENKISEDDGKLKYLKSKNLESELKTKDKELIESNKKK
ncbi:hypothetical protein DPMN_105030 [Dreissena polymorpha]|uniref:Uncharacterized protein n=1 Tax=Dreissena polymorpha TaxID=45954 RepID=A0A9D4HB35_DREPO|nr:hypothetical protein DPMN_105030 [Dreissena polymorpha]